MLKQPATTILLLFFLSTNFTFSQDLKFGKVSKEELEEKFYPLDSSANAAILYKKRRTFYQYQQGEGWMLMTKIHERIKIYKKEGYEWATKNINLYKGDNDETVSIKAYTFNLTNGKVEKLKLSSKEIFDEDVNEYWNSKKFTMPDLNEGSVIEWEYTIRSPYYSNISALIFQDKIPIKYIDAMVTTPEFFVFKNQSKGFYPINIKKSQKQSNVTLTTTNRGAADASTNYSVKTTLSRDKIDFTSNIIHCVQKNIPALIEEPYMSSLDNYTTSLEFEITAYVPKNGLHKYYNNSWEDVTKNIYESSNFGEQLKKTSHFKEDLKNVLSTATSTEDKLFKIFQFVKSKITWNDFTGKYTTDGVRKAYKDGVGNVAEINLTLVAMLREAGLTANPVLISTRDHGIPLFPTSQGFNYVIACVEIQNNRILLDATEKYSLPNVLPARDLNWEGRIVRKDGKSESINLFPSKSASEKVFLIAKIDTDALLTGSYRTTYNNLNAINYRNKYNEVSDQDLIAELEKMNENIEIIEFKVSNEEEIAKPLMHNVGFESDTQVEIIGDKMYFSPLFFLAEKENPFKLEERKYPVDFASPWDEKYVVTVKMPEGYKLESKPENGLYELPDNLGTYKFVLIVKNNSLQILSSIAIKSPIINSNNYKALKEFYKLMIDKQLEKVVLSKI